MDLFESLPWRISEPSVIDVGTKFIKEESIATSFVFLNNFVPEEKFNETEKSPKPRTRKGNCKILNKNRKSCLNSVQHKQCLQALQLIQSGRPLTSLSKKEQQLINIYNNLRMAIQQENAEFLKYVEGQWNQNIKKCKNNLYKYALQNRNEKINNVTNYPQFYANHRMIPLSNDEHPVEVLHDACLLEMGMVSKIQVPEVGRNLQMIFPAVLNENMCELTDYLKITKQPGEYSRLLLFKAVLMKLNIPLDIKRKNRPVILHHEIKKLYSTEFNYLAIIK